MSDADNPYQHTHEWHIARRGRLTSSRMHTVVHGGPRAWTTLIAKLHREINSDEVVEPDLDFVEAIAYGREHEPVARAETELRLGVELQLVGFQVHPRFDYMGCSADFLTPDGCTGEIKCYHNRDEYLKVYQTGQMPDKHRAQVECQMAVWGSDGAMFVAYHHAIPWQMRTTILEVEPKPGYRSMMIERCEHFMAALRGEVSVIKRAIAIPELF